MRQFLLASGVVLGLTLVGATITAAIFGDSYVIGGLWGAAGWPFYFYFAFRWLYPWFLRRMGVE